jgi:hypothetical protein
MAINLTENINHSGGGKIVSVAQSQGSWQSIATKATFDSAFLSSTTTKQNLANGQFFYVLDENQLYKLTVAGAGPFATYTLSSASFSGIDTSSFLTGDDTGSFVLNSQTGSFLLVSQTGSFLTTSSFNDITSSFILVSDFNDITSSLSTFVVYSASNATSASYIDPTFISASAAAAGFGVGGSNIDTSSFITSEQTSSFILVSQTSSFLLVSETGSFLTSNDTSSFIRISQTSSMFVSSSIIADTASYIDPTFISASAAAAGFGVGGSNIDTSSFVTNDQTSSFIRVSQTSSMSVATASYVDPIFISASAAASGFGAGGAGGIFTQNGSYYTTTNDLQITGSVTIGDGLLKFKEYSSLPSVEPGTIAYYNGTFWLGQDS